MSLLEKYYPELGYTRHQVDSRIRDLEYYCHDMRSPLAQRAANIHALHHEEIEGNLIHLYGLVRQTAQNQSSIQRQLDRLQNRSTTEHKSIQKHDYSQRMKHLESAYKISESKAYSLKQRIDHYYPRRGYRPYRVHFAKENFSNNAVDRQENLRGIEIHHRGSQDLNQPRKTSLLPGHEQVELMELQAARRTIDNMYFYHQGLSRAQALDMDIIKNSHNIEHNSQFRDLGTTQYSRIYNPINLGYQENVSPNKGQEQEEVKNQNKRTTYQQQSNTDHSVIKNGDVSFTQQVDPNNIDLQWKSRNTPEESLLSQYKQEDNLAAKLDSTHLSYSHTHSKFRPCNNNKGQDWSESDSDQNTDSRTQAKRTETCCQTPSNYSQLKKSASYVGHKNKRTIKGSPSRSQLGSPKRRRQTQHQSPQKNILDRIQRRVANTWALYEDSSFKNVRHQHQHLLNTYSRELKMRNEMCHKTSQHPLVQKKYGLSF